jgi:hypothetical protein
VLLANQEKRLIQPLWFSASGRRCFFNGVDKFSPGPDQLGIRRTFGMKFGFKPESLILKTDQLSRPMAI